MKLKVITYVDLGWKQHFIVCPVCEEIGFDLPYTVEPGEVYGPRNCTGCGITIKAFITNKREVKMLSVSGKSITTTEPEVLLQQLERLQLLARSTGVVGLPDDEYPNKKNNSIILSKRPITKRIVQWMRKLLN